jgi:hypothetical protein
MSRPVVVSSSITVNPDMPTKLRTEILTAAIAGFEEQKKRLDVQIAELRQMLRPGAPDGRAPTPVKLSATGRKAIIGATKRRGAASRRAHAR